ncbi:MAG TPA: hypothetical protein DEF11_09260, partial [Shigella sp.]|nr:hypothetical protein [Shigella sp.]
MKKTTIIMMGVAIIVVLRPQVGLGELPTSK